MFCHCDLPVQKAVLSALLQYIMLIQVPTHRFLYYSFYCMKLLTVHMSDWLTCSSPDLLLSIF